MMAAVHRSPCTATGPRNRSKIAAKCRPNRKFSGGEFFRGILFANVQQPNSNVRPGVLHGVGRDVVVAMSRGRFEMKRNVSRLLRGISAAAAAGLLTAGVGSLQAQSPPKNDPKDAAKEAVKDTRDAAKDRAEDARDAAKDAREAARDKTQDARDAVKDRAPDARDARDAAKDARDTARDTTRDARDAGRDARDRANDNRPTPRDPSPDARDRDHRDRDTRSDDRRDDRSDSRRVDFNINTFRSADMGLWFTSTNNNLVISDIASTGPIARLGFRADDRIVSVNGERVTTERDFIRYLYADDVRTQRVKVIVLRDGREEVIFVEPTVFVDSYSTVQTDPLEEFGVILDDRVTDQLVVWRVIPRTPAYYAGIRAGDVLTTYDGQTISGTQQLVTLVQRGGRDAVRVGVTRNKAPRTLDVEFTNTHNTPAERRDDRQDRREERREDRRDGDRTDNERQRALKVDINTPQPAPVAPAPVTPAAARAAGSGPPPAPPRGRAASPPARSPARPRR